MTHYTVGSKLVDSHKIERDASISKEESISEDDTSFSEGDKSLSIDNNNSSSVSTLRSKVKPESGRLAPGMKKPHLYRVKTKYYVKTTVKVIQCHR